MASILILAIHDSGDASGKHKVDQQRFTIKKPWIAILAENKKMWKEQAAKGDNAITLIIVDLKSIYFPINTI